MNTAWAIGGVVVLIVLAGGAWYVTQQSTIEQLMPTQTPNGDQQAESLPADTIKSPASIIDVPASFQPQTFTATKAAHFVSSEPANNALMVAAPTNVTIHFNFDLAPPSNITVTRDGAVVTAGATAIAPDKLSMSVPVSAQQTGNYQVAYTACWPDKSCHNGSFGFSVQLAS